MTIYNIIIYAKQKSALQIEGAIFLFLLASYYLNTGLNLRPFGRAEERTHKHPCGVQAIMPRSWSVLADAAGASDHAALNAICEPICKTIYNAIIKY